MKNYLQDGEVINITAAADLTSGTPAIVGSLLAIPVTDIATGAVGAACIQGVVDLPKTSADTITAGTRLTWKKTTGKLTTTAGTASSGDIDNAAVAVEDAASGVVTVAALLTPGAGSVA